MIITIEQLKGLRTLIKELYVHRPTGGHLHVLLDDQNIEDHTMLFCYRWLVEKEGEEGSNYETVLCRAIWHQMALMTHAQRWLWFCGCSNFVARDMNRMAMDMRVWENAEVCEKDEDGHETYLKLPNGEEYWMR